MSSADVCASFARSAVYSDENAEISGRPQALIDLELVGVLSVGNRVLLDAERTVDPAAQPELFMTGRDHTAQRSLASPRLTSDDEDAASS